MNNYQQTSKKLLQQYFNNHVGVIISIVPPPKTSLELDYILRQFKTISTLEYSRTTPLPYQSYNKAGFFMNLIYSVNPKIHHMGPLDTNPQKLVSQQGLLLDDTPVDQAKSKLISKLTDLVALPRHSVIFNDEQFKTGESKLIFKHTLSDNEDVTKYRLTNSTSYNPFISFESCELSNKSLERAKMRHNFQKFHKFQSITIIDKSEDILKRMLH